MRSLILQQHEVRALLDRGTVRVVRPAPGIPHNPTRQRGKKWGTQGGDFYYCSVRSPFGAPESRLWVRETWQWAQREFCSCPQGSEPEPCDDYMAGLGCASARTGFVYRADGAERERWRPSAQMPRWASRLTVATEAVRCMQVEDISEDDARAAGMLFHDGHGAGHTGWRHALTHGHVYDTAVGALAVWWESRYAERHPWCANPWVWAGDVRRVDDAS